MLNHKMLTDFYKEVLPHSSKRDFSVPALRRQLVAKYGRAPPLLEEGTAEEGAEGADEEKGRRGRGSGTKTKGAVLAAQRRRLRA